MDIFTDKNGEINMVILDSGKEIRDPEELKKYKKILNGISPEIIIEDELREKHSENTDG